MYSASVVSQHNGLKGVLVPEPENWTGSIISQFKEVRTVGSSTIE